MAVADDAMTNPIPEVSPLAFTRNTPAAVMALLAVTVSMKPVVVSVPDDVSNIAPPPVRPFAVTRTRPVEVVALFAVIARTSPVVVIVPVERRLSTCQVF